MFESQFLARKDRKNNQRNEMGFNNTFNFNPNKIPNLPPIKQESFHHEMDSNLKHSINSQYPPGAYDY